MYPRDQCLQIISWEYGNEVITNISIAECLIRFSKDEICLEIPIFFMQKEDVVNKLNSGDKVWLGALWYDDYDDREIINISVHATVEAVELRYGQMYGTFKEKYGPHASCL